MKKLRYEAIVDFRQVLVAVILIFFVARALLTLALYYFDIYGYRASIAIIPTSLAYLAAFTILILLLNAFKFYVVFYSQDRLIAYNVLTRKKKNLDLNQVQRVDFGKKRIEFYGMGHEDPIFKIPNYKFGKIRATDRKDFYNFLSSREDIRVTKDYKTAPGYGRFFVHLNRILMVISILAFMNVGPTVMLLVNLLFSIG